jgi:hypothetical protein
LKSDVARCPKHILSDLVPETLLASPNERFKNCCVAEHDRFGEGSLMVWGGISYDGSTDLYVIRNGSIHQRVHLLALVGSLAVFLSI